MPADRKSCLVLLLIGLAVSAVAQTPDKVLAHFGNHAVGRTEFMAAYLKNNPDPQFNAKAYRDYLEMYLRYRLKVQAAFDEHLDTLASQQTELQNFRNQITDQFSVDSPTLFRLVDEAVVRARKDIRVSVLFISSGRKSVPSDTLLALKKVREALNMLKKNGFDRVATVFSEDPNVSSNRGDLGFITVFDLPYALESAAYRLPVGSHSDIIRTSGGYAIVKKTAERPATGRIRVEQILLTWPYQATAAAKEETRARADSLEQVIRKGGDFEELARHFSGDNLTYQLGGMMPEFGVGRYDSAFEAAAFGLAADGDVSSPVESNFGLHLIKRIARIPAPVSADKKVLDETRVRVLGDARIGVAKKQMLRTMRDKTGMRQTGPPEEQLLVYTDTLLMTGHLPAGVAGKTDSNAVLFVFPEKKYLVRDWLTYRKTLNRMPAQLQGKTPAEVFDQYRQNLLVEYYRGHLEKFNPAFARQLDEFRAGNLLFEIMQRRVWDKASADTTGQRAWYSAHEKEYAWSPSADVIQFSAGNAETASKLRSELAKGIDRWRMLAGNPGAQVQADSGRVELRQLPGSDKVEIPGFGKTIRNSDGSEQFTWFIRSYPGEIPRSFNEARGMVINDFQTQLENTWITELKKKYPFSVNEAVLKTLPSHR